MKHGRGDDRVASGHRPGGGEEPCAQPSSGATSGRTGVNSRRVLPTLGEAQVRSTFLPPSGCFLRRPRGLKLGHPLAQLLCCRKCYFSTAEVSPLKRANSS